jgi:uncharacterized YigZ family protein
VELKDTYLTIERSSEGFYKEKGSKFLAFAYPVEDEDAIKERIADLKKKFYDARHYCYAYIMGLEGDNYRANDDGEPGHSAGDPILGQIRSNNLTNTMVVVVRYFGGTKLGVSGLINAYKTAAASAIKNSQIVEKIIFEAVKIQFEYPHLNQVMKLIKDYGLQIIDQKLEMSCEMTIGVRLSLEAELIEIIKKNQELTLLTN